MKVILIPLLMLFISSVMADCRVTFINPDNDIYSSIDTILIVDSGVSQVFEVRDSETGMVQNVHFAPKYKFLTLSGGVPAITFEELMRDYKMRDHEDFSFLGHSRCTEFEKNLIYFYVMEWFYFG